jgi:hypothetical protein
MALVSAKQGSQPSHWISDFPLVSESGIADKSKVRKISMSTACCISRLSYAALLPASRHAGTSCACCVVAQFGKQDINLLLVRMPEGIITPAYDHMQLHHQLRLLQGRPLHKSPHAHTSSMASWHKGKASLYADRPTPSSTVWGWQRPSQNVNLDKPLANMLPDVITRGARAQP